MNTGLADKITQEIEASSGWETPARVALSVISQFVNDLASGPMIRDAGESIRREAFRTVAIILDEEART